MSADELRKAVDRMEAAVAPFTEHGQMDSEATELFWAWQQVKRQLGYDAVMARFA
jgi:hypothetical protein